MPKNRKGKIQFSLRTMIFILTIVAVFLGVISFLRTEPYGIRRVRALNGVVGSEYRGGYDLAESLGFVRFRTIGDVSVENDQFSDQDLLSLVSCPQLDTLNISTGLVTDKGLESILQMTDIHDLDINCAGISDNGLGQLAKLSRLDHLTVYGSSNVTGAFLERFAEASPVIVRDGIKEGGLRWMDHLELHGPAIDDRACNWLAKFRNINQLDISHTAVTDRGLSFLESATNIQIRNLNVVQTRVTEKGIESFQAAHPETSVTYTATK